MTQTLQMYKCKQCEPIRFIPPYQNICHVIILKEFFSQIKSLTNKQHSDEKMGVRGLATYFGNRDLFFDEVIAFDILKRLE